MNVVEKTIFTNGFNLCLGISLIAHLIFFTSWSISKYTDFSTEIPFISVKINFSGAGKNIKKTARKPQRTSQDVKKKIQNNILREMENQTAAEQQIKKYKTWQQQEDVEPLTAAEIEQNTNEEILADSENHFTDNLLESVENIASQQVGGASTTPVNSAQKAGSNSKSPAEIKYEQALSLWLDRHKFQPSKINPAVSKIDSLVRIRISRDGKLIFHQLEKSSGDPLIDAGIAEMIKNSSPFPPVPENYPKGDPIDFLIPIRFTVD